MIKAQLRYACKADHRVSVPVFIKLWLQRFWHSLASIGLKPVEESHRFCLVAGCGNSGTTLLASKLGLHPDVLLIARESNIFFPSRSARRARVVLGEWLALAKQEKRRLILEKSPKHIHVLRRIRRLLPDSYCLIVIRNPLDTCASLYKRFGDLDYAIARWEMDNRAALNALKQKNTLLVRYESLTQEPEATLMAACQFLELEWDPGILTRSGSGYGSNPDLNANMSRRQVQVSRPIHDNNGKWVHTLSAAQADRVRSRTAELAGLLGYSVDRI